MTVSVVMAAQNAERWIAGAVESVLAQTVDDWELVVVDDGSEDGTAAAAEGFDDPRIRVVRSERIGVLAQVRNLGIEEASGEWVAFLDADDRWLPEKLQRQLAAGGADIGVVHTHWLRVFDDGRREPARVGRREPLFSALVEDNFVLCSSAMVRRRLFEEHGGFDPDPALWGSPDYELWLRLARVAAFAYVDEPLVLYRVHGGQMTADVRRMSLGALAALEKHRGLSPSHVWNRRVGMLRCQAGLPGRGRRELLSAVAARPWDLRAWKWLAIGATR